MVKFFRLDPGASLNQTECSTTLVINAGVEAVEIAVVKATTTAGLKLLDPGWTSESR
jgi:hypothetical protein